MDRWYKTKQILNVDDVFLLQDLLCMQATFLMILNVYGVKMCGKTTIP